MLIMSIMIISGVSPMRGININRMTKIVLMYAVIISISVTELSWPGLRTGIGVFAGLYEIRPITLYIETYIYIIGLATMVMGGAGGRELNQNQAIEGSCRQGRVGIPQVKVGEAAEGWPIMGLILCLGMSSLISSNEIISILIGIE